MGYPWPVADLRLLPGYESYENIEFKETLGDSTHNGFQVASLEPKLINLFLQLTI
jgi:hypothetical protein